MVLPGEAKGLHSLTVPQLLSQSRWCSAKGAAPLELRPRPAGDAVTTHTHSKSPHGAVSQYQSKKCHQHLDARVDKGAEVVERWKESFLTKNCCKACSEDKFFQSKDTRETSTYSPTQDGRDPSHVEVGCALRSEEDERISGLCSCPPSRAKSLFIWVCKRPQFPPSADCLISCSSETRPVSELISFLQAITHAPSPSPAPPVWSNQLTRGPWRK